MADRILIAMPCAHSIVTMWTTTSVSYAALALAGTGAEVRVATLAGPEVTFMRNYLAGLAVRDRFTHLLFVDSDMAFPAEAVLRLLQARRAVVGAIYPRRILDLERLVRISREKPDTSPRDVVSLAQQYVIRLTERAAFTDGFSRVAGIGMGLTMIATSALQRLIDAGAATPQPTKANIDDPTVPLWNFFNPVPSEHGGELSEDYSFCKRWTDLGGEVWGLAAPGVEHIGEFHFTGDILATGSDTPPEDDPKSVH